MIGVVFEGIVEIIFELIVEVFLFFTGEIILYILTLGKRTPTFKIEESENLAKIFLLMDISVVVGFIFWLLAIVCVVKITI